MPRTSFSPARRAGSRVRYDGRSRGGSTSISGSCRIAGQRHRRAGAWSRDGASWPSRRPSRATTGTISRGRGHHAETPSTIAGPYRVPHIAASGRNVVTPHALRRQRTAARAAGGGIRDGAPHGPGRPALGLDARGDPPAQRSSVPTRCRIAQGSSIAMAPPSPMTGGFPGLVRAPAGAFD